MDFHSFFYTHNLGYVLNVIEDPVERVDALVDAYRHAKRLLVVSGLINETVETARAVQYRDGVVTQRNTFQKYFEQQELQQYIEDALDTTALPVALGVFYVFRDPVEHQDFCPRAAGGPLTGHRSARAWDLVGLELCGSCFTRNTGSCWMGLADWHWNWGGCPNWPSASDWRKSWKV